MDAAWLASPFWQSDEIATCCTQVLGDLPTLGKYIFGTKFLEEEPETAEAIIRALARTNRTYLQGDYHDDPEVMAILSQALGAPEEQIASSDEYVFDPNLGIDLDYVTKAQEIWITGGALEFDEPLDPDRVVDTRRRAGRGRRVSCGGRSVRRRSLAQTPSDSSGESPLAWRWRRSSGLVAACSACSVARRSSFSRHVGE